MMPEITPRMPLHLLSTAVNLYRALPLHRPLIFTAFYQNILIPTTNFPKVILV
jgi:hypothetical protein